MDAGWGIDVGDVAIAIVVAQTTTGRAGAVVALAEVAGDTGGVVGPIVVDEALDVSGADFAAPGLRVPDEPQAPRHPIVTKPATRAGRNDPRAGEPRRPAPRDALPVAHRHPDDGTGCFRFTLPMAHIASPIIALDRSPRTRLNRPADSCERYSPFFPAGPEERAAAKQSGPALRSHWLDSHQHGWTCEAYRQSGMPAR